MRRRGFPTARVLAVAALALAVGTLLWVLSGIGSSSTSTPATSTPSSSGGQSSGTGTGNGGASTGNGSGTSKGPAIDWKTIKIAVINGFDPSVPAADETRTTLQSKGWKVVGINQTDTSSTQSSYVTYPPGKLAAAKVVAQRLHLPAPVPLASATGVPTALRNVAIVLGPNLLPAGA